MNRSRQLFEQENYSANLLSETISILVDKANMAKSNARGYAHEADLMEEDRDRVREELKKCREQVNKLIDSEKLVKKDAFEVEKELLKKLDQRDKELKELGRKVLSQGIIINELLQRYKIKLADRRRIKKLLEGPEPEFKTTPTPD